MSDTETGLMVKRTLVTLSHAIEQAVLARGDHGPVLLISLFQRLPYFDRERHVYRRLAAQADVVVVGFVDDFRPDLAGRAHPVLLSLTEPLAREWTVVMLTPGDGAFLVAYDEECVAPGERTLEAGRLFDARWGFGRGPAREEARRLRRQLADRLPPGALSTIDALIGRPGEDERDVAGVRAQASIRLLTREMERAKQHSVALQERLHQLTSSDDRNRLSGLHTPTFLRRWIGSTRTTTASPLPLALILVAVTGLADSEARYGARATKESLTAVAAALTRQLGTTDRAIQLGDDEFLIVAPGTELEQAAMMADEVGAELHGLRTRYPFLPVAPVMATMITRDRPLPLDRLRHGVSWARAEGVSVATLPS